jgi:hypothetical protein
MRGERAEQKNYSNLGAVRSILRQDAIAPRPAESDLGVCLLRLAVD